MNYPIKNNWHLCRFMSCSVLPVRMACNCHCSFCFSKSSISSLSKDRLNWRHIDIDNYYKWSKERGATRLVITGGGEPLLRPDDVLYLVTKGKKYFNEITCFSNGSFLTTALAQKLKNAGLSYICYSRHHHDDKINRQLMGKTAPLLQDFLSATAGLQVRATCVMAKEYIDSKTKAFCYMENLQKWGIAEFTFKHTYVAYSGSVFQNSHQNDWAYKHKIDKDPFINEGNIITSLPWGPKIRRINDLQVCYYYEPTPNWERSNLLCRSSNLLTDRKVYASLEDQQSLLYQLPL